MHIQLQSPADQLYLDTVVPSVYLCVHMEGERSDDMMNSRVNQYVTSTWCVNYNLNDISHYKTFRSVVTLWSQPQ